MADGTPDFTDLLAAFDDPPAVNPHQNTIGVVGSNFQGGHLQFTSIPNQLQVNAIPYGDDHNQSLFAPVNQTLGPPGQLRQISASSQNAGIQNQGFQQPVGQSILQANTALPVAEEPSFTGGSLGSMFLDSVELALSGENNDPYVKITQPTSQAKPTQRRPRQRSKQNQNQLRTTPQPAVQNLSNANGNSSVQLSPFGNVAQATLQTVVPIHNAAALNPSGPKTTQVSSPPFILPSDVQMATMGQRKIVVQNQFMHPTQIGRQQMTSGPPSNPPRPLSAASSTSDHLSRPGSVPQPSPSCGSSHSGDPATPLTPQSYNASVPQNYNAATPQPRSITPQAGGIQQQRAGSYSDISRQMQSKTSMTSGNNGMLSSNDVNLSSPMTTQNTADNTMPDLPSPVKQMLTTWAGGTGFQDMPGMAMSSTSQAAQPWYDTVGNSGGLRQVQAHNASLPSEKQTGLQAKMQPNYMGPGSQAGQGYGQTINALGMTSLPVAAHFYDRNDGNSEGTGSLTQTQSKLLEQMASFGSKMKNKSSTLQQSSVSQSSSLATGTSGVYTTSVNTAPMSRNATNHPAPSESSIMIEMMNKASDTGSAAVKELFDSHATQYEAISPVSDYAMSPISKSNMTDDSLFGQTKVSTDQSNIESAHDDTMTDPVLMYIKHDNVPQATSGTSYGSSHSTPSFPQNAGGYYSSSLQGLVTASQPPGPKESISMDMSNSALDARGNSGSSYFPSSLSGTSFSQPTYASGGYSSATTSDWQPFPVLSKSKTLPSGDVGLHPGSAETKTLKVTESLQPYKDKEKSSPPINYKSPSGKQSGFGVHRRKSSTEKSKFSSALQAAKSNSLESDFGFDSDDNTEPTIRLSKPAKLAKGNNSNSKRVDAAISSPKQNRTVNPHIPNALKDKLEQMRQLQQQNQLLQQMKQIQAEQAARATGGTPTTPIAGRSATASGPPRQITPKLPIASTQRYQASKREGKAAAKLSSPSKAAKKPSIDISTTSHTVAPAPVNILPSNHTVSVQPHAMGTSVTPSLNAAAYQMQEKLSYLVPNTSETRTTTNPPEANSAPRSTQSHTKVPASVHSVAPHPTFQPFPGLHNKTHGIPMEIQVKSPVVPHFPTLPSSQFNQSTLGQVLKSTVGVASQAKVTSSPAPPYVSSFLTTNPADFTSASLAIKNVYHKLPAYTAPAPTTTNSPGTVSISQTMMSFPYPNVTISQTLHPHFFHGGPMPTFSMSARPAHFPVTSKSDIVTKSTSTIATNQLPVDLDWLPPEPDVPQKTIPAPKLSLPMSTTAGVVASSATSAVTTAATIPGIPKPSFYQMKTDSALPQKLEQKSVASNQIKQNTATTLQTPTTKTAAITSEPTVVHHETKQHYGKKHRILEGSYPNSSEGHHKYGQSTSSRVSAIGQTNGIMTHSVLDKQRRYSKEHASVKPKKTHRAIGDSKAAQLSKPGETPASANLWPSIAKSDENPAALVVEKSKVERRTSAPKSGTPNEKDDQAGSMLSLFNSLLQEASNASLNTTLKSSDEKDKSEHGTPTNGAASSVAQVELVSKKTVPTSAKAQLPSTVVPSATSDTVVPVTAAAPKNIAKKRPAATVPFKRRPFPAIDDIAPVGVPVVPTPASTVTTTVLSPVMATRLPLPVVAKQVVTTSQVKLPAAAAVPTVVSKPALPVLLNHMKTPEVSVTETSDRKSPEKAVSLPKLRITAFRSSGGQVIHQSSMVGAGDAEPLQGAHHHKRWKKKKKKKRKKRRASSSDYDSSVSSMTSMSSFEPVAKIVPPDVTKGAQKEIVPEVITEKADIVSKIVVGSPKQAPKRKRPNVSTVSKEPEKKKPVAAKRAKITKESAKKKPDAKSKEPVARYQPKSAFNVGASTPGTTSLSKVVVSLPSNFHRAPGKLPLYMNSSESKSTTVPTIQLVARNTKLLETVVDSNKLNPGKVVSVKVGGAQSNKSISMQRMTNTGLQYIVSGGKTQQRIILPNITSALPMSIVSPIMSKTVATTLVPVSVGTLTSPASNKTHFLPMPMSVSDSVSTPVRLVGTKLAEAAKVSNSFVAMSSTTVKSFGAAHTLADSFTKGILTSPTTSRSKAATMTVSVLQTNLAVVSTMGSKVTPPIGSPPINSFQSTFSKLISGQNPVARYTPSSPPAHLNLDLSGQQQHQCHECKDTFMFQNSLVDHYERRSIMIKVRCMQCDESLLFLNKCKLLKHARQHSDKGNGMQFNNAHISPLPISMCKPRSKESFLNNTATSFAEKRRSTTSSEDDLLSSSIGSSSTMTCTDCSFVANNPEALEEHFQQQVPPVSPDVAGTSTTRPSKFTCDMCNLTLFNQCSFMAHMRMHKRVAPHTCPECGQTFDYDGKDMDFNLHMSIQCFHLSRMSCYKCRLCCSIFKNADLLRRHLEVRHLQTFYKCRDCPMAFKTQENINSHQRTAHGIVVATKMIHKCPLCDTVFTDNSPTQQIFLLQKHFEAHINHPSINITAYKCLFCNNIYERKSLLREHLKSVHDVTSSADTGGSRDLTKEMNNAKLLMSIEKKKKSATGTTAKKATQKRLITDASSAKDVPAKIQKTSSKSTEDANSLIASGILGSAEGSSKKGGGGNPAGMKHARQPVKLRLKGMTAGSSVMTTSVKPSLASDDVDSSASFLVAGSGIEDKYECVTTEEGRKVFRCRECGKEFPSQNSCLSHMRIKHEGIRVLYCCPYCPVDVIKFAKRISLKKHLKKVHDITEIRKQDVRMVYAHVPPVPEGQRFDPSTIVLNKDGKAVPQTKGTPTGHKVRKKVTGPGRKNGDRPSRRVMRQARQRPMVQSPSIQVSSSDDEPTTHADSEDVAKSGEEESDFSKLRFPDIYKCAKCEYESSDRLEFQVHIIEHKEEAEIDGSFSSIQQCTECGLCFASSASIAKHLFIKHKIKRKSLLEKYDEQLKAKREAAGSLPKSLMGDGEGTSSASGSGSNAKRHRCSVCYRRFDTDSLLRTHMRTHGLAFVKSKAES